MFYCWQSRRERYTVNIGKRLRKIRQACANEMPDQKQLALTDAAEWLGDWHPLAEQLGSTDGLVALGSVSSLSRLNPVHSVASLRHFLQQYQSHILLRLEMPVIQAAHGHAIRHEVLELVVLDQQMAGESSLRNFSAASQRV